MSYVTNYIPGASDKVAAYNQFFYDAYRTWGVFYARAYKDLRAYAGDNWSQQEKTQLLRQRRMILELNKIRRIVNLYSGYERENRSSIVVGPVEQADELTAEQLSATMLYVYDKAQAEYIFSEAFDHHLKTGMAIVGMYIDYSRDKVNGDIKFYWKPFNAMIVDPYFTKRDFSDADQVATRDLLSRNQVEALLPWVSRDIIENIPTGIRDNKYQYLGIYRQYNSTYIAKNLLTYDQYWKRTNKLQKYLVDKASGLTQEWDGSEEDEKMMMRMMGENRQYEIIEAYKPTVELGIIVGGQLVYEGADPCGLDDFPFVPLICYHEPLIDTYELKIQGVVRSVIDAQKQYNRRHSQIIDIMESIINTGWVHKNGAVIDPEMLFQSGQGRNIVINQDFDVNADLREISPPQIPQGYLAYQDIMDRNIMEIPGGSDEILGLSSSGDGQVSGRLAEVRASNGLKGNRGLFDNYEYAQKLFGEKVLRVIQKNFTAGKVQRIINQEPTEQFFSGQFDQYDCAVKQTVKTQTQREAYYYHLLQMRSIGIAIPDDEIVAASPMQGHTKLLEKMAQQQQLQQQIAMQEAEDKAIKNAQLASERESNLALAEERRARVLADIGLARERISESDQNYAKALLDNIMTVRTMENMDAKTLMESVRMIHDITQPEKAEEEAKIAEDKSFADLLKDDAAERTEASLNQTQEQQTGGPNG